MAKLAGGTTPPKPVRTPPIKRPPVPVVTPRGVFTPGAQPQPWVNPRAAESAAIGQAVAGAYQSLFPALPAGQNVPGRAGIGGGRLIPVDTSIPTALRTAGPAYRSGFSPGAGGFPGGRALA